MITYDDGHNSQYFNFFKCFSSAATKRLSNMAKAAAEHRWELVQELLNLECDPNSNGGTPTFPLFHAVMDKQYDMLIQLLQHKADPNLETKPLFDGTTLAPNSLALAIQIQDRTSATLLIMDERTIYKKPSGTLIYVPLPMDNPMRQTVKNAIEKREKLNYHLHQATAESFYAVGKIYEDSAYEENNINSPNVCNYYLTQALSYYQKAHQMALEADKMPQFAAGLIEKITSIAHLVSPKGKNKIEKNVATELPLSH